MARKRRRRSASVVEPAPKKARRDLTAEVSQSRAISAGVEAPPEGVPVRVEEPLEDEDFPSSVRAPRSRSKTVEEGELVERPLVAGDTESPEVDIMGEEDVEIPGISTQPESPSAHEGRDEVQQPGSPSVFISNPRAVDPSPTTGVIGGKAPVAQLPRVALSSSSSSGESDFEDKVDYGDEPADQGGFFDVSEEEQHEGEPSMAPSPLATIAPTEGILFSFCLILSFHVEEDVLMFFFYTAGSAGGTGAQPEGIEASVAETTSVGATVEVGEPSPLPGRETTIEAEEALTLPVEEATAEAGETPILQDSTPLDLDPSKAALTEGAQVGSLAIGTLPEGHTAQFSVEVSEEVVLTTPSLVVEAPAEAALREAPVGSLCLLYTSPSPRDS